MPRTGILRRKFVAAWPFPCPAIPTKGRLLPLSRRTHKAGAGKLAISPRPITYSYMSSHPLSEARLVPSTLCACATVLVYDWMCTLDQEISCVWSRPRTLGTLFFVFNRYLPFIDVFLCLSGTRISAEQCLTRFKIVGWFTVIGIFLSEVILMLRTYALWERRRGALISLSILSTCTVISTAVFTHLELASLEYLPSEGVGCQLEMASSIVIYAYLTLMISETSELRAFRASTMCSLPFSAIVIMTVIKAYRDLRRSRQPWLVQLYHDGMLFYVYLLAISLANILVPVLAPSMFSNWLATPQRVLHSVLCTRVLLLIRGRVARGSGPQSVSVNDTGLIYTPRVGSTTRRVVWAVKLIGQGSGDLRKHRERLNPRWRRVSVDLWVSWVIIGRRAYISRDYIIDYVNHSFATVSFLRR
ncbi:hypothetical protein DFH09DRAFT_649023 [Mycena vulgaris]|nr:hypothetical protein DFH09DRAFT_649023 [Mycena vulgaris]